MNLTNISDRKSFNSLSLFYLFLFLKPTTIRCWGIIMMNYSLEWHCKNMLEYDSQFTMKPWIFSLKTFWWLTVSLQKRHLSISLNIFVSFTEIHKESSTAVPENSQASVNGTPARKVLLHTAVLHTTLSTEATTEKAETRDQKREWI